MTIFDPKRIFQEMVDKNFTISETLRIKVTPYGTNPEYDDASSSTDGSSGILDKFKQGKNKSLIYSYFLDGSVIILVGFEKKPDGYHLAFGTSNGSDDFSAIRRLDGNAFSIFGKVMFVAKELATKYKIKKFMFESTDLTSSLYSTMLNSRQFQEYLKKNGIVISKSTDKFVATIS